MPCLSLSSLPHNVDLTEIASAPLYLSRTQGARGDDEITLKEKNQKTML